MDLAALRKRDLVMSLVLPLCYNDFKSLSLVSRDFSSYARPYLLRTLKPFTTTKLGSQTCLQLLLSREGWAHANHVRSVTIHLDGLDPDSPFFSPEHAVAAVISRLPHVLHVTLVPQFQVATGTVGEQNPPVRNFDYIVNAMSGLPRIRTLNMPGVWPGGRAAAMGRLQQACVPLQNLQLTLSDNFKDPLFCVSMVSGAPFLRSLRIHEPMNVGAITALVRALPRPDRLRELRISVSNVSESNYPWYQLGFWDALSGLEELYVSGGWRSSDFDHSGDCAPPNWDAPLQEISPPLPDRRDDDADLRAFSPFLHAHPSLRVLYFKCSNTCFPWGRVAPPHFQSLREAYQNRILMDVTPDSREDWMIMNELDDDVHTASSWLNEQRRTWFVGREVARIKTWAQNVRERVVRDAITMATIAPALERVRWMPYKEDITPCPWPLGADCGDGDFVFDIIVRRPSSAGATTQPAADVEIGGGIKRVSRCVQCAGIASPQDAAEIPFDTLYGVEWAAEERVQSPVT